MEKENCKFAWQWQILKSELPAPARHLLLTLSIYMSKDGNCWPSMQELATVTGLSFNTVKKYIRLAIKKKVLKAENAGLRGAKSQQMQYFAVLSKTDCQQLIPSIDRLSTVDTLHDERLSNDDRETVNSFDTKQVKNITKTFLSDSIEYRLSIKLFDTIKKRNSEHKTPNFQKWAKDINLMIQTDGRKPEKIAAVIAWSQADDFWQNNILSPAKLRKHYDSLFLKMNGTGTKTTKPCRPTRVVL